ncbi:MAG: M48 family metallopeptidase [Deltaproteobacteria bacterium]|nr:M48 family metallopeptidase [Deltaproteobacteria bacterium]
MQLQWSGHYLDGKSAKRQRAAIYLEPTGLRIDIDGGATLLWPYGEINQTQGAYAGEQVRLEHGGDLAEALLIDDERFLTSFHELLLGRPSGFFDPRTSNRRLRLTVVAGCASVVLVVSLYLWGIPTLARVAAPWVPVSWEERLGQNTLEYIAPENQRCHDPARQAKIEAIVQTLLAAQGESNYRFKIYIVNQPIFNALAAPGGHIVIFRGLLDRTENAEELAGVLAHELQHVLKRHVTRALLEYASSSFLFAALVGDVSGIVSFGVEAARMLAQMRFSRQHELEADEAGVKMLHAARVDPAGMIAFFEAIKKEEGKLPAALAYISTHPQTDQRIARLTALTAATPTKAQKLLPNDSWDDLKKLCPAPAKTAKE